MAGKKLCFIMKPEWKSGQSLSGLKIFTQRKRCTKSTILSNLNMTILNNELSGYEVVTGPRGVHFVTFLCPSPRPRGPLPGTFCEKRWNGGSATNNSVAVEHLKKKSERKDDNYCPAPLPAHAYQHWFPRDRDSWSPGSFINASAPHYCLLALWKDSLPA